ncbi:MAG TPA: heparinase II/III family protein [Candidatus Hydrogenedentes bacterium]|nr:heparinase II/III family protein [Candidatus Hydrogenedentota bacterium]
MEKEPSAHSTYTTLERHKTRSLFPELAQASPEAIRQTPRGKDLYEWAQQDPGDTPPLTYTLYRIYKRTGDRDAFQRAYFGRRDRLERASFWEWFEPSDAHLDRVCDLIWAICEETTWVLPAHEGPSWNIDLFNAETGALLADISLLLGDRIPEEVRERMRFEVDKRIFTNYLAHYDSDIHWWHRGINNWTGVCSGSIGQAALVFEKDPKRQAEILSIVIGELNRYIDNGFESDGGCLEGVGYWGYGLLHLVAFSQMLSVRTEGEIDLLLNPKMEKIARYPLAMSLGGRNYASFADSRSSIILDPSVAAALASKTGVKELLPLAGTVVRGWSNFRGLLWWDGSLPKSAQLEDVMLPASGLCRIVGDAEGAPIVLVVKAGHNAESHNHNDVGSFIVSAGGETYLCDPGTGLYQRSYFDEHRYENIFTRSFGHSVPLIDGKEQSDGKERCGAMTSAGDKSVRIDFAAPYQVKELKEATRTMTMNDDGTITFLDSFDITEPGVSIEEAFMTWQSVKVDGAVARIESPTGCLALEASDGVFAVKSFEEECRANKKEGVLSRIALGFPAAPKRTVHITMRFEAK